MTAILEDAQEIAITKWGTLNTAFSPHKLPEGHSPNNQNVWMDEMPGSIVSANGYQKLGTTPSGLPTTFLLNFFKTSDGSQTLIISDGVTVWKTTDYLNFAVIMTGLSPFFQLRGMVIRDKLWLTNGSDRVATYDGTTLVSLDGTGGKPDVPVAKYIDYHDERVWLYGISGEPSSLRFSDLTDSAGTEIAPDNAAAWPTDNELQISQGDADIGTGLFVYRGYLYASKSFSIWRIVGYDEYTYTKVKTRSSTGTRFEESVAEVDNLVHFIGVDGLYTFDGETSTRISDLIDPANPAPGVFAFRNLQQPLLNNKFWNLSNTADFNTGTVPRNLDTSNNRLTLKADDSQADFEAGSLLDRIDTKEEPGSIKLSRLSWGGAWDTQVKRVGGYFDDSRNGAVIYGAESSLYDGNWTQMCGMGVRVTSSNRMVVTFDAPTNIGKVVLRQVQADHDYLILLQANIGNIQSKYGNEGTWVTIGTSQWAPNGADKPRDIILEFAATKAIQVCISIGDKGSYQLTEIEAYRLTFSQYGKYVSKPIDFGISPMSLGNLSAIVSDNGATHQFFTQSSSDGSSWEGEYNISSGEKIKSNPRRFIRWGVYFFGVGAYSPVVSSVFVGGSYLSPIFNTGGNIFQWGAFQLAANFSGQTINAYYRAAATSGGVLAAAWTPMVNGSSPNTPVTNVYIQIRLELSTADASMVPYVTGTTVNWILSNGSGANTLQNVASFVWLNRYWLSAATVGAKSNDIVLVRGKATYANPWHKKDFSILSFARYQDYFVAGSSVNGDLYRMETGYSKAGLPMDCFYETADFDKAGFLIKPLEIIVNTDRSGPYSLVVGISIDGGITYREKAIDLTRSSPAQNAGINKKLILPGIMADKFRLRFRINAADQLFSVDEARVYYRLSPVRGSLN